jgi:oxygen-independent coproporphyrinogen-3 oxidase
VEETLAPAQAADEMLLMGLRLREGIRPERYAAMGGRAFDPRRLGNLLNEGFVERLPGGRLRATAPGWLVLDSVVADLAA